jgi:hypothetical protein
MSLFKVIIAGSRTFDNYEILREKLDKLLVNKTEVEIVSGTCHGADLLGERYAIERAFRIKYFPADWEHLGRSAGIYRT